MISKFSELIRTHEGPLTSELVRSPGHFGLGQVPTHIRPDSTTSSICGFCSTGCSLKVHLQEGKGVNLTPDSNYPVNLGMACPKGWEALTPLESADRAVVPRIRDSGEWVSVDWEKAANIFCDRIKSIQERHGKESVAFLSTGQICTEEMALLGVFAKFGMGMIHGDGNTRQCMATAVAAYKESFGFDAPPYTYQDFEESDVIVLIGSNLCVAHPIMWQRILRNPNSPEIIVLDPRKTETAMQATQHVALRPKSDLALLYGIANQLIANDFLDREYIEQNTADFESFRDFLEPFTPERTEERSGISGKELSRIVSSIGNGERVSFWWTMGVNQGHEATRTAQAIINLALMTGNIGRPGTGANSITGQCNAMGSRLFSLTTALPGGRSFSSASDREFVASVLGIDSERIQQESGWTYDQIIDGIEAGKIKTLWVIATNGAHSWIDQSRFRRVIDKLEFLVVQDLYTSTETASIADLVLPAAGWGEKEGTFINSERRFGVVKKVRQAPGEALSDFAIFRLLAKAWGVGDWIDQWNCPESAFQILKQLTEDMPCDINGIEDYRMIEQMGGIQWPAPKGVSIEPQRRLFEDGRFHTDDRKARFIFEELRPLPETPCREFPFELLTGRGSSGQWHTQTRTGKSEILEKLNPSQNFIEVNPIDARALGLTGNEMVLVTSRRGSCQVKSTITANVPKGQAFMPMHFAETNLLTRGTFDPYSRQPSYKYAAVQITRIPDPRPS